MEKINWESKIGETKCFLTVISVETRVHKSKPGQRVPYLKCKCRCGKETTINGYYFGRIKSCGCSMKGKTAGVNSGSYKHGLSNTKLIDIWDRMRGRCYNKNNPKYPNYGGRGILMCKEWHNSVNFINWALANGYKEGLSIERKDVHKGYEPENCCFITMSEQAQNKTNTWRVEYNGEIKALAIWCRELGLNHSKMYNKVKSHFKKTGKKELII